MGLRKFRGCRGALAMVVPAIGLTVLVACGGSSSSTDTASGGSSTSTPAATTATTAAPVATTATTAAAVVLKAANSDKFGPILTDASGKSLYTFDKDTAGTSTCSGGCATTWPALLLPAGASTPIPTPAGVTGTLTVSPATTGGSQIVLNGKPLYRYAGDANPGDTNGDGVGGIWHIAKPS